MHKLNVNQSFTVILLAGEDDPFAELEGSSELLGSEHKTKQNELNFALYMYLTKKQNISLTVHHKLHTRIDEMKTQD